MLRTSNLRVLPGSTFEEFTSALYAASEPCRTELDLVRHATCFLGIGLPVYVCRETYVCFLKVFVGVPLVASAPHNRPTREWKKVKSGVGLSWKKHARDVEVEVDQARVLENIVVGMTRNDVTGSHSLVPQVDPHRTMGGRSNVDGH